MDPEFYVHYNPDTSRIEGIKPHAKTKDNNVAVKITGDQAERLLLDNESILDWVLGKNDDEQWVFGKKDMIPDTVKKMDTYRFIELKDSPLPAEITLILHANKAQLTVDGGVTSSKVTQYKNHFGTTILRFMVTEKSDPTLLVAYIDFDLEQIRIDSKYLFLDLPTDYRECSIFAEKKFESYKLITE